MTTSLADRIAALGTTKNEVAETLRTAGIVAVRREPCDCAIAEWVHRGGFTKVAVTASDTVGFYVESAEEPDFVLGHSGPVPEFIKAFDRGEFPDLVREMTW